jgi:hypothetical protein
LSTVQIGITLAGVLSGASRASAFNIADARPNALSHARDGIHLWIAALIACQASEMSGVFEVVLLCAA